MGPISDVAPGNIETSDADFFAWFLQQSPVPRNKFSRLRPDFLVISPPKTGSTWLAACLGRHPGLFVPSFKESRYFSLFGKSFDFNWYLDHFAEAGARLKGEASPSYCLLPPGQIRLVRRLLPEVKLVFLMREPIARAWAHARHNFLYRETIFGQRGAIETITDEQWRTALVHDWLVASGDYLGQLRRWLDVFPRQQIFVGFYESICREPFPLLREVFGFLGAGVGVEASSFPLAEKVMRGLEMPLTTDLERYLHGLLHERTVELAAFLREQFGLEPPPEWQRVLTPVPAENRWSRPTTPAAFRNERDEGYLAGVLAQEEGFLSAYWGVQTDYRGYDIVFRLGKFYALARALGEVCLERTDEATLAGYQADGRCFIASTLAEVKQSIDQRIFEQVQARLEQIEPLEVELRAELAATNARIEQLQTGLNAAVRRLGELEAKTAELHPLVRSLVHVARAVRRGFARFEFSSAEPWNDGRRHRLWIGSGSSLRALNRTKPPGAASFDWGTTPWQGQEFQVVIAIVILIPIVFLISLGLEASEDDWDQDYDYDYDLKSPRVQPASQLLWATYLGLTRS